MRNVSRFLAIVGVAAVIVAVTTPPASAGCPNPKIAATFSNLNYVYIDLGAGVTPAQVKGRFYVAGNPSVGSTPIYGPETWLFVDLNGKLSMSANLSAPAEQVAGCPAGKLVTQLQTTTTPPRFLTMTSNEGESGSSVVFDYSFNRSTGSLIPGAVLPRPRVATSARAGGVVNLTLGIDATTAGNAGDAAGAVTGYDIVRASGADPGRDAAAWTLVQNVPTTNGGAVPSIPLTADCSNPSIDQFFATRLVFGDGQKADAVSDATRVNCNPALAEPRFNVVPKKPTGPKKQGTRN